MRLRLLVGTVGFLMGVFGLLRFLQRDLADIVDSVLWLAGGVLLHDAVIAPLTIAAVFVGTRVVPSAARRTTVVALVVLLTVTMTAIPVLGGFGVRPDNPSLLDRNYVVGWCVFAALVLLVSLCGPLWRRLGRRTEDRGGA